MIGDAPVLSTAGKYSKTWLRVPGLGQEQGDEVSLQRLLLGNPLHLSLELIVRKAEHGECDDLGALSPQGEVGSAGRRLHGALWHRLARPARPSASGCSRGDRHGSRRPWQTHGELYDCRHAGRLAAHGNQTLQRLDAPGLSGKTLQQIVDRGVFRERRGRGGSGRGKRGGRGVMGSMNVHGCARSVHEFCYDLACGLGTIVPRQGPAVLAHHVPELRLHEQLDYSRKLGEFVFLEFDRSPRILGKG
jgi:hypothetical protein